MTWTWQRDIWHVKTRHDIWNNMTYVMSPQTYCTAIAQCSPYPIPARQLYSPSPNCCQTLRTCILTKHDMTWHLTLYDMIWYVRWHVKLHLTWHVAWHLTWHDMTWHDIWHYMIWHVMWHVTWHDMICYMLHVTWHDMTFYMLNVTWHDMWHVTCDIWHDMACDRTYDMTWHVT